MFCANCGTELKESDKFCKKCGNAVKRNLSDKHEETFTPTDDMRRENMKYRIIREQTDKANIYSVISKVTTAIGLLCFFFPFVILTAGSKYEDRLSGINFITSLSDNNIEEYGIFSNIAGGVLLVAMIFGVLAIFSSRFGGFIPGSCLIIFKIMVSNTFDNSDISIFIDLKFGTALWLAFIAFIISEVLIFIKRNIEKNISRMSL